MASLPLRLSHATESHDLGLCDRDIWYGNDVSVSAVILLRASHAFKILQTESRRAARLGHALHVATRRKVTVRLWKVQKNGRTGDVLDAKYVAVIAVKKGGTTSAGSQRAASSWAYIRLREEVAIK